MVVDQAAVTLQSIGTRNTGLILAGMTPKTLTPTHCPQVDQLRGTGGGMETEKHLGNLKANGKTVNLCLWTLQTMFKNGWARK